MARTFFWQVARAVFLGGLCIVPGVAAETTMSPRQAEILRELSTFRPSWAKGDGEWMLGDWRADEDPSALTPSPTGNGNAASCFKLLEDYYPAEAAELERDGSRSRGVDALLAAAEMAACRFMPEYYPEFDSVDAPQPDFKVMRVYLQALLRRGELAARSGDRAEAERCYRAGLICGQHLTSDRSSSLIYVTGLIFQLRSAQAYAGFLVRTGETEQADAAKRLVERLSELMRAFMWKANTALSEFRDFACLPAAARIAAMDAEPFWRKEAVVRLATLRYGVPDGEGVIVRDVENERLADEALLRAASEDPDPTVRRLAIWCARNLTPRDYERLEHRFRGVAE